MRAVPVMLCVASVWPSDVFWVSVKAAVHLVEGELTMVKPDTAEIEQMILRSWLDYSTVAGTA